MKRNILIALSVFVSCTALAQSGVVVIVNKSTPIEKLDPSQATQIFLKQVQTWSDGTVIQPVDLTSDSSMRADFYSKVTGRSIAQVRSYWARQAFTGQGFPPRELATVEDVKKFVGATPGAIGYVDRKSAEGATKIVLEAGN